MSIMYQVTAHSDGATTLSKAGKKKNPNGDKNRDM